MNKKIQMGILAILLLIIAGEGYLYVRSLKYVKEPVPAAVDGAEIRLDNSAVSQTGLTGNGDDLESDFPQSEKPLAETKLPAELNLKATFYSQAPFANWDYPWQEACEEASVLLAANEYFGHNWTREQFNDEILKLVDWQKKYFGHYEHTTVKETVKILNDYLGLETIIHENPTYEDVQKVLSKGHFIVMTFAGKKLGNPNYTNGGPVYHAMLIKGYKEGEKIITHDVGTRHGEDYVYSWSMISNALRDYAEPIEMGAKRMIEVLPPDVAVGETDETANNQ